MSKQELNTIEDIKEFFKQDERSYYFISATNFNLMSLSDWVRNWFNVNFIDCYDEKNESVILANYKETPVFEDIESINQFLLGNKDIVEHIKSNVSKQHKPNAMFLFYDNELEKLVDSLGMNLIMPPNKLVKNIDNKITTTEIGNSVDVPSAPNALLKINSYRHLCEMSDKYNLGSEVVIQTPFGDSGKTTYFVSSEEDYQKYADEIEAEEKVKVMKRLQCQQVAIEACATKKGSFIGPILTEIIGHPKLTPYKGGWCGNDVNPDMFSQKIQDIIYQYTDRLGQALYKKGYSGYFEVDYLIDMDAGNPSPVYLGEINPRVTGISAITNTSSFCTNNIPLFLFHLLEFCDIDFNLSSNEFNQKVRDYSHPEYGQLIFKYTQDDLKILTEIPETGVYKIQGNKLVFLRSANNPASLNADELFLLRILKNNEYVYKGADLLIMFSDKRLQDKNNNLTSNAENFISVIQDSLVYRDLNDEEVLLNKRYGKHANIKSSAENT